MTLLTPKEAALYLRIPPSTVKQLCREGKLPARKLGKQWRLAKEEIEDFFKKPQPQPKALQIASKAARHMARDL